MSGPACGVLFDLDGTLLDTAQELIDAVNLMLADLDMPPLPSAQVHNFIGKGVERLVARALKASAELTDPVESDTVAAAFQVHAVRGFEQHYKQINGRYARAYPGALEALQQLQAQGVVMGLVTNKPTAFTLPLMNRQGLTEYFDIVVCGDTLAFKKPRPEMLLYAAEQLGHPQRLTMVGDSANDAIAARAANIPVYLMSYGYTEGLPLDSMDCDGLASNLLQLLPVLTGSSNELAKVS